MMASKSGDDKEQDDAPPPAKKRKLSSYFSNSFVAKSPIFDQLENVTFIVGNKETGIENIRGNRTIFAVQSDVFQAQLFGNMAEGSKDEIVIDDITPEAFTFLKNLFYVQDEQLTVDIVLDVLYASKKYLLLDLECACYKFIENVENLDDWWKLILQQKITTDIDMDDALIRKSQVLIKNSESIAKDSEKLSQLTPEWLAKIVQSSSFVINSEDIVWEMCVKYCQDRIAGSNDSISLDEKSESHNSAAMVAKMMNEYFVKHIRFAIMDRNYFFDKIEKSGILDGETKYDICKCCLFDNRENRVNKYKSGYCWYPRKPFYHRFFARYDIRMVSKGDVVIVVHKQGGRKPLTIESIDWKSAMRNSTGDKGISFTQYNGKYFENYTIECVRQQHCLASMDVTDGHVVDIIPSASDVKAI